MARETYISSGKVYHSDDDQTAKDLDSLVKGEGSAHGTRHTDGNDDIQSATAAQKGVATAAQITKLDGIATGADVTGSNPPQAHEPDKHSLIGARAYLSADQDGIAASTWTKVALNTEDYDEGADFDTANNRYVVPTTGLYLVTARVYLHDITAGARYRCAIYVGGALARAGDLLHADGANDLCFGISDMFDLTAADQVELYVWCVAPNSDLTSGIEYTSMSCTFMGVK